jgi:hypothetical protein
VRQADESGKNMKKYWALIFCCAPAMAAISGTVVNGTTGQPQAGTTVSLVRMTQTGPEPAGETKADAQGKFSFSEAVQGPTLLRATIDGVTYNRVLPPGTPSAGLTFEIYDASKQKGSAKVSKHMLFFQPTGKEVVVNETYIFSNPGKTAFNDPSTGTLHVFLPSGATKVQMNATAPGGMPLPQTPERISRNNPDVYKVNFPVRPGDTRFDLSYYAPYSEGQAYKGKIVSDDENTYLIVPEGITMKGDNLRDMGVEPRTKAHIFGVQGDSYEVQLAGTIADTGGGAAADSGGGQQDGSPPVQEILPRLYDKTYPILALALGILAVGFVLLYRSGGPADFHTAREPDDRGHR